MASVSPSPTRCTLHRLDASQGVLPEAADWLLAHACNRLSAEREVDLSAVLVVVPGRRAGHRLLELLLDRAATRAVRLAAPEIVTLGQLPELLSTPARPLADPAVETLAWVSALVNASDRDRERVAPGLDPAEGRLVDVASSLAAAHRELASIGLGFAELPAQADDLLPGFGDHARWETLARLERHYLDRLDDQGLWDRQTARREAIKRGEVTHSKRIVLLATVDIDVLQRRMLEQTPGTIDVLVAAPADMSAEEFAVCFDHFGCIVPEAWATRPIPVPLAAIAVVDDADGQADAIVDWLARLDGRRAADEITIAVPDDALAPAVEQKLAAAGVAGRYGTGRTVRRSSPWQMLAAVFDWLAHEDASALAALLRSPPVVRFVARKTGLTVPAALADDVLSRHLPLSIDREHLARAAERPEHRRANAQFLEIVATIDAWLAPLHAACQALERPVVRDGATASDHASAHDLATNWTDAVRQVVAATLEGVTIDHTAAADRVVARAVRTLGAHLSDLATVPDPLAVEAGPAGLARLLLATWAIDPVPPLPEPDAIDIVGWLEVPLDDAAALVITSAVEGCLPSGQSRDPLLPETLRAALALEDAARIAARDAWILTLATCCRSDLLVLVPRLGSDGSPMVPSRLLFRRDPAAVVAAAQRLFVPRDTAAAAPVAAASASRLIVPRPPSGPVDIASMRVTEFRDYIACPYRYWLRHRLRLAPASDAALELGPADFGTLVHECLDRFAKRPDLMAATDAAQLADELSGILDTLVRFRYGPHAAPAVAVQAELARRRLHAFAHVQARRAAEGWRIHGSEHHVTDATLDVDGVSVRLSARIDRIDVHPESGRWQILDYKTAARGRMPESSHRTRHGWVDLQLPLYRHLLATLPAIPVDAPVDVGYFNVPARVEEIGIRIADWTPADYESADETARGVVRNIRAGVFWPPNEAAARSFPEFDAICQTRALVEDDGGEEP